MTATTKRIWAPLAVLAVIIAIASAALGGWRGEAGFGIGSSVSAINLLAWKAVLTLLSGTAGRNAPKSGAVLIVIAFLTKLPLFVGAVVLTYHVGGAAPGCFLAGVALVYFALVRWAFAVR